MPPLIVCSDRVQPALSLSLTQVDALRSQIKHDRAAALLEKEEQLAQRDQNLMALEEAAAAHSKCLAEERRNVQQLVEALQNQMKKAYADSVTATERAAEEQERLKKLQHTLENELEDGRRQHDVELKRCSDERHLADEKVTAKLAELERERQGLEDGRNELARQKTDWAALKAAERAELEVSTACGAPDHAAAPLHKLTSIMH